VSLSCRMFGNLLGGYVVMELLYSTVFTSFGLPVIGAAFFSLFHYGMQAFIFITLSLAFVEEAIE
jgi:F-type H+-transporting ATPase subunit a